MCFLLGSKKYGVLQKRDQQEEVRPDFVDLPANLAIRTVQQQPLALGSGFGGPTNAKPFALSYAVFPLNDSSMGGCIFPSMVEVECCFGTWEIVK